MFDILVMCIIYINTILLTCYFPERTHAHEQMKWMALCNQDMTTVYQK